MYSDSNDLPQARTSSLISCTYQFWPVIILEDSQTGLQESPCSAVMVCSRRGQMAVYATAAARLQSGLHRGFRRPHICSGGIQ